MAHTPDQHFKGLVGQFFADATAKIAILMAENESLRDQLAQLTTPPLKDTNEQK